MSPLAKVQSQQGMFAVIWQCLTCTGVLSLFYLSTACGSIQAQNNSRDSSTLTEVK
ncbi:hypothetical protein JYQ62_25170 [Nostoc sp. UHCC 0702]|nr:hypothetical protein JYQ62_25170 [Nostoc sp. UHCC 0702]